MARPKGSKDTKKRPHRKNTKAEKLVGSRIGRWMVESVASFGKTCKLNLVCDCGTIAIRNYDTVAYGRSLSCGCRQAEITSLRQIKPDNLSVKVRLFNNYRLGASTRGYDFKLTLDQVFNISQLPCYYCDTLPHRIIRSVGGQITVNGIDRVDNSIGYQIGNVVACCKTCNLLKKSVSKNIILKAWKFFNENT